MTRTYVRYFGEDQVASLDKALLEIGDDWKKRRVHVGYDTRQEGDQRLMMATLAIKRLTDRVPE